MAAGRDAKALVPGRTIFIEGHEITVYPAGVRHAGRLFTKVIGVLEQASTMKREASETEAEHAQRILQGIVPFALKHALDIVGECTVLPKGADFDHLPHYFLAPIVKAWIEESFGEEKKWRPWLALVEEAATRLNGGKEIRMSEIWSKASSLRATASGTSSNSTNPESRIAG